MGDTVAIGAHDLMEDRIRRLFADAFRGEAAAWDREGGIPRSAFERLGEVGAFKACWPAGAGASGNLEIRALLIREMALTSVGACVALGTHTEAYFRALERSEYGQEAWPEALSGRRVGAFSVSEATGGSQPTHCATVARRNGGDWILDGHKHYVSNLRAADDCVVFTRTANERDLTSFTFFIVPLDAAGVRITPHALSGARASATGMIDLEEVRVGDERRVGVVGSGLVLLLQLLRDERILAASAGLAVAELCFEMALAFTQRRQVNGIPLHQHQAIAHRLAELASDLELGRALMRERLAAAGAGRVSSAEAGQAKLLLNRIAWRTADEAVQLLGGRGYTEETALARTWREIRLGRIGGGTDEVQLELIAQSLRPGTLATHPAVLQAAAAAGE